MNNIIKDFFRIALGTSKVEMCSDKITLTDAQIKNLPVADLTLCAAPGAGRRIAMTFVDFQLDNTLGGYTNISPDAWATITTPLTAGYWDQSNYLANDSGYPSAALTELSAFFGTAAHNMVSFAPLTRPDPPLSPIAVGGAGWLSLVNRTPNYDQMQNKPLVLHFNNAALGALTGGNAGNSAVITYQCFIV